MMYAGVSMVFFSSWGKWGVHTWKIILSRHKVQIWHTHTQYIYMLYFYFSSMLKSFQRSPYSSHCYQTLSKKRYKCRNLHVTNVDSYNLLSGVRPRIFLIKSPRGSEVRGICPLSYRMEPRLPNMAFKSLYLSGFLAHFYSWNVCFCFIKLTTLF